MDVVRDLYYRAADSMRAHLRITLAAVAVVLVALGVGATTLGSSSTSTSPPNAGTPALVPLGRCVAPVVALKQFVAAHPGSDGPLNTAAQAQYGQLLDAVRADCPLDQVAAVADHVLAPWQAAQEAAQSRTTRATSGSGTVPQPTTGVGQHSGPPTTVAHSPVISAPTTTVTATR